MILTAFFSWGGNTRRVAEAIQRKAGGELFEIVAADPYPADYNRCLDRANAEKRSSAAVALAGAVPPVDLARVGTLVVGFPNWLSTFPRPVAVFLEGLDLSGKRVLGFCTHAGGGAGRSGLDLIRLCPGAKVGEPLAVLGGGGSGLDALLDKWLAREGLAAG
jgi:flavodoxin